MAEKTQTAPQTLPEHILALDHPAWRGQRLVQTVAHLCTAQMDEVVEHDGMLVFIIPARVGEIICFLANEAEDACDQVALQVEIACTAAGKHVRNEVAE